MRHKEADSALPPLPPQQAAICLHTSTDAVPPQETARQSTLCSSPHTTVSAAGRKPLSLSSQHTNSDAASSWVTMSHEQLRVLQAEDPLSPGSQDNWQMVTDSSSIFTGTGSRLFPEGHPFLAAPEAAGEADPTAGVQQILLSTRAGMCALGKLLLAYAACLTNLWLWYGRTQAESWVVQTSGENTRLDRHAVQWQSCLHARGHPRVRPCPMALCLLLLIGKIERFQHGS